jgi:hypothetical protein
MMSLSDFASVGSFVSGIAVMISLIYLALQVKQNSRHTRALIMQGRAARITGQYLTLASSDLVSAWIVANGASPTPEAVWRRQFALQSVATDYSWEDTFYQYEAGLLGEHQFGDFRAKLKLLLRDPGLRSYFSQRAVSKDGPTPFHRFVDDILSETAASPTNN